MGGICMALSGNNELSDRELDRLLREEWKSPPAPAHLRGKIFPPPSWWNRFCGISIRVPLPVACCLTIVLGIGAWRWQAHLEATAGRGREAPSLEVPKFQPVRELRPRIVKAQIVKAQNNAEYVASPGGCSQGRWLVRKPPARRIRSRRKIPSSFGTAVCKRSASPGRAKPAQSR